MEILVKLGKKPLTYYSMIKKKDNYLKVDESLLEHPAYRVVESFTSDDGFREYLVLDKDFNYRLLTSVTTALPKPPAFVLQQWKDKVGAQYADNNSMASSIFGNRLHDSLTRIYKQIETYDNFIFEKYIREDLDYAMGNEVRVVSLELGIAGTFDFLFRSKTGEIVLVDLKNHSRIHPLRDVQTRLLELPQDIQTHKKKKWKEQGACYAQALRETYNVEVDTFCVWCYNQGTGKVEKPVEINKQQIQKEIDMLIPKLNKNTPDRV